MVIVLASIAAVILLVYSLYFTRIIKGEPQVFELELIKALADWMIIRGTASKKQLWVMILLTVASEIGYFWLAFIVINNIVMQFFTGFVAGLETIHIMLVAYSLNRFFKGRIVLKDIFFWPLERTSAILFFTHSLLVLAVVIFF